MPCGGVRFLRRVPLLVHDNLKTGTGKPGNLYDPKIGRSHAELAARYGFLTYRRGC